MKIIEYVYNIKTAEDTIVERDATAEEQAERTAFAAEFVALQAEAAAKEAARQAILDRLGLTAEEAKLLLG